SKRPAPPESQSNQLAVHARVDQMTRCRDLRPRRLVRQIAAGIRGCRVELQRREWEIVQLTHGSRPAVRGSNRGAQWLSLSTRSNESQTSFSIWVALRTKRDERSPAGNRPVEHQDALADRSTLQARLSTRPSHA